MKIEKIDRGSLSARAYVVLREGLISGQFKPGQRLVMQDLAELLGTSITPVREACLRLVSEKGLELRSGRFVIVPEMTRTRYLQVKTIRLALEGLATELAAEHATSSEIARLSEIDELYAKYDLAGEAEKAFRYNREFHFGIYRLSGMDMLVDQIENLWVLMGPMFTIFFQQGHHQLIASSEHKTALAALSRGDGKIACRAIQDDIMRGGEDFLRFLSLQNKE